MSTDVNDATILKVEEKFAYKDSGLPLHDRVSLLIKEMTIHEKVAQMMGIWKQKYDFLFDENNNLDKDKIKNNLGHGIGQIGRLSDSFGGLTAREMAKLANSIQKYFKENTRLGIPVVFHEESLHGLVAKEATSYPQPIGLASTFNPDLVYKIFELIARDARSRGAHQVLTPVLDVARDPRWGRVEETFGEDPYLISQLGIAAVSGLQGNGCLEDGTHVMATLKHFAAHGAPESGTNCGPVNVSERLLRDIFLMPFKEVVTKARAISVMASYNEIDGVPSHANKWLLKNILRDEWDFSGFIVSDYYAITELNYKEDTISHSLAESKEEAAKLAVRAGVNIELPEIDCYPHIIDLVDKGLLEESEIDELIAPVLEYKFKLGLFENPYVDPDLINTEQKLEKERELALQAARETITLLKNEANILPLKKDGINTLAVIGPNADRVLLGGYSGTPKFYTTVLQGIKNKVADSVNVLYSEGCKITVGGAWDQELVTLPDPKQDEIAIKEAVEVAEKADKVILVLGGNEQTSREAWSKTHLGDTNSLELFGAQNDLVKAVFETGKPIVVLLINGRPNSINYINENIPGILECWYLGQETGRGVADVLFGDYNPGGKLPISIPRSAGHIPCFYNRKPSARRGYLFESSEALFPFGFGLSYSKFTFKNIILAKSKIQQNEATKISVDVTNIGEYTGTEVVQMYIRDLHSSVTRPVKELKGFKRVSLKPGESKTIEFDILPDHLAFTDINMNYTVEPGDFNIMIGNSSRDEDLNSVILTVL